MRFFLSILKNCLILVLFPLPVCAAQPSTSSKTISETIPITMANVRGHAEIYNEGWFVVSSSERALRYAKEHGVESASKALRKAQIKVASRVDALGSGLKQDLVAGGEAGRTVLEGGTRNTQQIMQQTDDAIAFEKELAADSANAAYSQFVNGYLTLGERTSEDLQALSAIPAGYFSHLHSDFSNIAQLSKQARDKVTPEIESSWSEAFERGKQEFVLEYEKSGEAGNALSGLWNLLKGYSKALYYAVLSPGAERVKYAGTRTGFEVGNALALPTSALLVVSGRTVQSIGMTVWYTTRTGIKLVSPTVEGGLLAGLSVLSATAIPVTAAGGAAAGVLNQVAVTAATPVAAAATTATGAAIDTAKYGALVVYDLAEATTRVSIEELSTGVVLGYNALTALPTQAVLGVTSGIFFLAWDGPRLVVAYATGSISNEAGEGDINDLPVGSVVDLKRLGETRGMKVEVISDDAAVIDKVLQSAPQDMRQER